MLFLWRTAGETSEPVDQVAHLVFLGSQIGFRGCDGVSQAGNPLHDFNAGTLPPQASAARPPATPRPKAAIPTNKTDRRIAPLRHLSYQAAGAIKIREKKELGLKDALWIGTFQGVALIPGISRSAATIGAGLWRGATAFEAVRFSFLLSLPAVLGGTFLELFKARDHFAHIEWSTCLMGFAAATIMGLATVRLAIPLLQKGILRPFAWYCLIAGTVITLYLYG